MIIHVIVFLVNVHITGFSLAPLHYFHATFNSGSLVGGSAISSDEYMYLSRFAKFDL